MWLKQAGFRSVFAIAVLAVAYFVSAKLTFAAIQLSNQATASVLYPPIGIALAGALLLGRNAWIGVFIGAVLFGRSLNQVSWLTAIVAGLGNTIEVLVAMKLLERVEFRRSLRRVRDVLAFVGIGAVVAPSLNATVSTFNGIFAGIVPSAEFASHWIVVWLGDAVAVLVLTPAIIVWVGRAAHFPRSKFELYQALKTALLRRRVIEFVIWLGLIVMSSWMILNSPLSQLPETATGTMASLRGAAVPLLQYSPFLFIVWAALRLGQRGTVICVLIASFVSSWGVAQTYRGFESSEAIQNALFQLQIFIGIMATIALVLAAAIAERKQVETLLRRRIEQDHFLAESTLRIRRSLNVAEVLNTTVAEVREFLKVDRVYINVFDAQGFAVAVAEAVAPSWSSMLGARSSRSVLEEVQQAYHQNRIRINSDSEKVENTDLLKNYYRPYQIKASLGLPIYQDGQLYGVLNVNQCRSPREWQSFEIELLDRLATQMELALQQGRLYEQVQGFAVDLEFQVQEHTAQLQQKMTELHASNQMKDTLVHAVTHDLRTPVIGMLMVLKRLQSKAGETISLSRSTLDRIVDSSDRQLELISSLLEDHTLESQKFVLKLQPVSLLEVIDQALRSLEPLLMQNHVILDTQIPNSLPLISADSVQLKRVLNHLITNAIEHNPPEILLTLRAEKIGAELKCTIVDNGVGISRDQCDRLFIKPYLRGSQNQHRTGLGLGLFLCHQIITAHQGEIGVFSQANHTQFWFTIPLSQ